MQTDRTPRFVFLDVEATGLDHARHEMTEIAWIVRHEDGREEERQFFPFHTTDGADADALELTRYEERIAPRRRTAMSEWLPMFLRDADGAVIVGAVPDFDVRHLEKACRKYGVKPTWDHHLLDVETLALPLLATGPERPRSLAKTCEALGVTFDRDQAHGALYDARLARAVFDRVWELLAALGADTPVVDRVPDGADAPIVERVRDDAVAATAETTQPEPEPTPATEPAVVDDVGEPDPAPAAVPAARPALGLVATSEVEPIEPPRPSVGEELEPEPEIYEPVMPAASVPPPPAPEPVAIPLDEPQNEGPAAAPSPKPIRPFDAPEPASARSAEGLPAPARPSAPLVEEAVTVLPKDGVEDALFGGRPKKIGHPQKREPDTED